MGYHGICFRNKSNTIDNSPYITCHRIHSRYTGSNDSAYDAIPSSCPDVNQVGLQTHVMLCEYRPQMLRHTDHHKWRQRIVLEY